MPTWAWSELLDAHKGQVAEGVLPGLPFYSRPNAKGDNVTNCESVQGRMIPVCELVETTDRWGIAKMTHEPIGWLGTERKPR